MPSSNRVERRLGWVTADQQRFPREKAEDWLDAVERGLCPVCGAGPYGIVATHVNKAHGIDRFQLKDILGVTYRTPLCDPLTSAKMSQSTKGRDYEYLKQSHPKKGYTMRLSKAARQRLKENNRPGNREYALTRAFQARIAKGEQRDQEILVEYEAGASLSQIADKYDRSISGVYKILHRARQRQADG